MAVRTVLIAEDDPKTAASLRLYLEHEGYAVLEARDGAAALRIARDQQPSLIPLDWMLPAMSGWAGCRALRRDRAAVPIILLTARSLEEDELAGLRHGADDYITKPFSPREVMARIR